MEVCIKFTKCLLGLAKTKFGLVWQKPSAWFGPLVCMLSTVNYTVVNNAFARVTIYCLYVAAEWKKSSEPCQLARTSRRNSRLSHWQLESAGLVTDFMAEVMMAPQPSQGLAGGTALVACGAAQAASAAPLLLREQLQAIPLLSALVVLEPAKSAAMKCLHTNDIAKYVHSSHTDRVFEFRIWFGIGLQTVCTELNASLDV